MAGISDLLNRALMSSVPDVLFPVTIWIGPCIGQYGQWRSSRMSSAPCY